jgi:hypothetical protein
VPPPRRSDPTISRFNPGLWWLTIIQRLARLRRAAESAASSVPDRNALWCSLQSVAKYSTPNVLGPDWIEVASELPVRLPQQCQERHRLAHTVMQLTFVFLRVTFRGSPFLRSAYVLSKDADAADSARPIHYSTSDSRIAFTPAPTPCSRSSLSQAHRFIGFFCDRNFALAADSARHIAYSVSDSTVASSPSTLHSPLDMALPCST